jgi:hypothetical protein
LGILFWLLLLLMPMLLLLLLLLSLLLAGLVRLMEGIAQLHCLGVEVV